MIHWRIISPDMRKALTAQLMSIMKETQLNSLSLLEEKTVLLMCEKTVPLADTIPQSGTQAGTVCAGHAEGLLEESLCQR